MFAGNKQIHIIDANNVSALNAVAHLYVNDLDLTDVEICGDVVITSYRNNSDLSQGGVRGYNLYNANSGRMDVLWDVPSKSTIIPTLGLAFVIWATNFLFYHY